AAPSSRLRAWWNQDAAGASRVSGPCHDRCGAVSGLPGHQRSHGAHRDVAGGAGVVVLGVRYRLGGNGREPPPRNTIPPPTREDSTICCPPPVTPPSSTETTDRNRSRPSEIPTTADGRSQTTAPRPSDQRRARLRSNLH